nr:diguanylate cyclase [Pseudomonas sp. Fl5BN2]
MGCLRKQDVLGRIGGEEFSCLLVATDEADAVQMAERIRQGFSELTMLMSPGGSVQASA